MENLEEKNKELIPVENTELSQRENFANIEKIIKAELDNQITTAKAYPRNITQFIRTAVSLATLDEKTAESCLYSLPRQGKFIEGPSIRLAEIIASSYCNLRAGSQIISNDGKKIVSRGYCHDLETNFSVSMEVTRRITDKNGKTYNDDMQVITGNAANAISFRNAIFKVIPMAITNQIILKVRGVIAGTIKDIKTRREQALGYFEKLGIKKDRIFDVLGIYGTEDIGEDELITLLGFVNAINNSEISLEDCFPEVKPESKKAKEAEQQVLNGLNNMTNGKKGEAKK